MITAILKVDPGYKAKQFLWRGTAADTLSADSQGNAKRLDKSVDQDVSEASADSRSVGTLSN